METYIEEQEEILENLEAQFKKFKKADPNDPDTEELSEDIEECFTNSEKNLNLLKMVFKRYVKRRKKKGEKVERYERMIINFEEQIQNYKDGYKKLKSKHTEIKQQKKREQLFEHAEDKSSSDSDEAQESSDGFEPSRKDDLEGEVGDDAMGDVTQVEMQEMDHDAIAHEVFKEVYNVQNENLQIAHRLVAKADTATEIASEVIEVIELQNEQLRQISAQLDDLGGSIKRAFKELYGFSRGLATEYAMLLCIYCCACWIFIVVLLAIICKSGVCNLLCDLIPDAEDRCRKIPGLYTAKSDDTSNEEKNNANIVNTSSFGMVSYGGSGLIMTCFVVLLNLLIF